MITLEEARALKIGDRILLLPLPESNMKIETTVSYIDADRLHVAEDSHQFLLENCKNGIEALSSVVAPVREP